MGWRIRRNGLLISGARGSPGFHGGLKMVWDADFYLVWLRLFMGEAVAESLP